jgi:hypothetical protein
MKRQAFVFLVIAVYTAIVIVCALDTTYGGSHPVKHVGGPDLGGFSKKWLSDV